MPVTEIHVPGECCVPLAEMTVSVSVGSGDSG